jgi:hypothetical protein
MSMLILPHISLTYAIKALGANPIKIFTTPDRLRKLILNFELNALIKMILSEF